MNIHSINTHGNGTGNHMSGTTIPKMTERQTVLTPYMQMPWFYLMLVRPRAGLATATRIVSGPQRLERVR